MRGLRNFLSTNFWISYTQWPTNVGGQTTIDSRGAQSGFLVACNEKNKLFLNFPGNIFPFLCSEYK